MRKSSLSLKSPPAARASWIFLACIFKKKKKRKEKKKVECVAVYVHMEGIGYLYRTNITSFKQFFIGALVDVPFHGHSLESPGSIWSEIVTKVCLADYPPPRGSNSLAVILVSLVVNNRKKSLVFPTAFAFSCFHLLIDIVALLCFPCTCSTTLPSPCTSKL